MSYRLYPCMPGLIVDNNPLLRPLAGLVVNDNPLLSTLSNLAILNDDNPLLPPLAVYDNDPMLSPLAGCGGTALGTGHIGRFANFADRRTALWHEEGVDNPHLAHPLCHRESRNCSLKKPK